MNLNTGCPSVPGLYVAVVATSVMKQTVKCLLEVVDDSGLLRFYAIPIESGEKEEVLSDDVFVWKHWKRADRVLVEKDNAIPPFRAVLEFSVVSDVVFVRDDGWTLGAPSYLAENAYEMWKDSWTHFMYVRHGEAQPIDEWTNPR